MCDCYLFTVNQSHQALAAADVIADMTIGQPVDHVAIIHHVSSEKQLIFTIMEADTATRVTRHVEHSELSIPQVDDIALTRTKKKSTQNLISHAWLQSRQQCICTFHIICTEDIFVYKCHEAHHSETGRFQLHCSPSSDTAEVGVLAMNTE